MQTDIWSEIQTSLFGAWQKKKNQFHYMKLLCNLMSK